MLVSAIDSQQENKYERLLLTSTDDSDESRFCVSAVDFERELLGVDASSENVAGVVSKICEEFWKKCSSLISEAELFQSTI